MKQVVDHITVFQILINKKKNKLKDLKRRKKNNI